MFFPLISLVPLHVAIASSLLISSFYSFSCFSVLYVYVYENEQEEFLLAAFAIATNTFYGSFGFQM